MVLFNCDNTQSPVYVLVGTLTCFSRKTNKNVNEILKWSKQAVDVKIHKWSLKGRLTYDKLGLIYNHK